MKLEEYKGLIAKTAVFPQQVNDFGKAYAYLGLIDELQEFNEAIIKYRAYIPDISKVQYEKNKKALLKEAGDVLWYVVAFCIEWDMSNVLNRVFSDAKQTHVIISYTIYSIAGNIKKYFRDGKVLDVNIATLAILNVLLQVNRALINADFTLEEAMQTNYDKLMKRKKENKIHGDGDNR